jgi:hypothetical protein
MDKETRNRIQKATQAARGLLEQDFEGQLSGVFDIRLDGNLAAEPGSHLDPTQRIVRTKLVAAVEHFRASGQTAAEAVASYRREAAFTTLNRFVALKMLEARGLVQECLSRGEQSSGFKEFCGLAPGLVQLPDRGYRLYIESLFDELSVQIRVLFNRRDASSLLWPKRTTLELLQALLNAPELAGVWGEDETLGWIYQYYNDEGERKKMREASAAPRTSRELAVRNQFFTPRYVVEFLTDNTLGRLWYEMTRGQTRLKAQCRYLVRRPTEIFLQPGESAPEGAAGGKARTRDSLSQEELLRQPVHIPHRPLKDPRDIRLLDPACGSMHFGLYAFDLFEVIYAEAWDIAQGLDDLAKAADTFAPFVTFAATFSDPAAFRREVPRLIVEHNLHGIDIDRRAVQIAGLSLWLRAQRAWYQAGVRPADRPRITRSNIVCAEPMPGEKELLREFIEQQFPVVERPAFTFLLEKVFDHMTLAGEAGSLLRIEEEIRGAIAEASALARRQSEPRQIPLFPGEEPPKQAKLDLRGLTDEQFWQAAEQRIYAALKAYAEQTESGSGFRRRLFAEDAAQGFSFIDLCRKRYDVVVMNPPFGQISAISGAYIKANYRRSAFDLFASFLERGLFLLKNEGALGAITTSAGFYRNQIEDWRASFFLDGSLRVCADLGGHVLDGATVRAATYVRDAIPRVASSLFVRCNESYDKPATLTASISQFVQGIPTRTTFSIDTRSLNALPGRPLAYWLPDQFRKRISELQRFSDVGGEAQFGLSTKDDFRFLRLAWEVGSGDIGVNKPWCLTSKGGVYSPFYFDIHLLVLHENDFRTLEQAILAKYPYLGDNASWVLHRENKYYKAGVTFQRRTNKSFAPRTLPKGCLFTDNGPSAFWDKYDLATFLGLFNSSAVRLLAAVGNGALEAEGGGGANSYEVGIINNIVVPPLDFEAAHEIGNTATRIVRLKQAWDVVKLETRVFVSPVTDSFQEYISEVAGQELEVENLVRQIDELVNPLYGFQVEEIDALLASVSPSNLAQEETEDIHATDAVLLRKNCLAYAIGLCFGRWDIRYANGERPVPDLPDPFAQLPACSPGMLQGEDGLPLSPDAGRQLRAEGLYPLDIAWDGILVDDPEHPLDIERRIHDALAVIWGDRTDAIQQEACALLGMPTLRDWFRRPAGFFADHLKRYSKSRRQAPIYWPVSSLGGRYSLWLYYHRFSKDTLYRALEQVKEKVSYEERRLQRLTADVGSSPVAAERAALADQESLVTELRTLQAELARVAPLWNPNLNDGVILNYGPLWRMIGHTPWQKAVKEKWEELVAGKFDWAHLAMHLWPERVVPQCAKDRSLAIAHGLEAVFWEEGDKGKWVARTVAQAEVDRLIAERTSAAVKDALKSLLDAPAPVTGRGGGRKSSGRAPVRRAPTTPRSDNAGPGSRPATGSVAPDPVMLDAVKQAIAAAAGGTSKSEVLAATGLSDAPWNIAINALLSEGTIIKTGAGRGTRYHLNHEPRTPRPQ